MVRSASHGLRSSSDPHPGRAPMPMATTSSSTPLRSVNVKMAIGMTS